MDVVTALVLGIVEGLTEFLPISSTGHLILVGEVLGFTGDKAATFDVFIQLGAILAVVVLYRRRFVGLLDMNKPGLAGKRGLQMLAATTAPALVAGFLLHGIIKDYLFNPMSVAIGLLVGGIALILVERLHKSGKGIDIDHISTAQALKIGCFQTLALAPGVSRSGATIVGGRLLGLSRQAAVEYSFLAAVPVMIAAVSYDLYKSLPHLQASDFGMFAVGFVAAFVSALLAITFFVKLVARFSLEPFGWYRIGLAVLTLVILVGA